MTILRRTQRTYDPPPASVLSPAELARAEEEVKELATYWLLEATEIKGLLFDRYLIETGRLGKGDRS